MEDPEFDREETKRYQRPVKKFTDEELLEALKESAWEVLQPKE